MVLTSLIVAAVSTFSLYQTAIDQHRLRLIETVKSQARLIEAIAGFGAFNSSSGINSNWQETTLQQVKNAHSQFSGFGQTGEFTLARRSNTQIEFVLSHRHYDLDTPRPIPFEGKWAQPMRLALAGNSGTVIALDYRGVLVLAAHEPISLLDLGLVAKIDLAEIRAPFVRAGLLALGVGMLVVLFASSLFFRITKPIAQQIEQQAETFRTLAETSIEGIVLFDEIGKIEYINPAAKVMFGYDHNELIGESINRLIPKTFGNQRDDYIEKHLKTRSGMMIDTEPQLVGLRKNGDQFPIYLSIGDINLEHTRLFAGVVMDISQQIRLQREIMEVPVREQRRIGQELHDGIGQQLTGLGMLATSLLNKASRPMHDLASQLATGLQETLKQVRALSHGLVPIEIDAQGFTTALRNLTENIQQQSHVQVNLELHDDIHFSNNTMVLHLYRIIQEALNNAIKHGKPSEIRISLSIDGDDGLLKVYDNGKGIADDIDNNNGLGLSIMKYRSNLFEGEIKIHSGQNGGTMVTCRFPLKHAGEVS